MTTVVHVGIDLSLRSPAVAMRRVPGTTSRVLFLPQRKRERGLRHIQGNLDIRALDNNIIPTAAAASPGQGGGGSKDDVARYVHVVGQIVEGIRDFLISGDTVHVHLEQYAFGCREQSAHSYKLMELGGILKWRLSEDIPGLGMLRGIPITAWKKSTVGKGNASKEETLEYVDAKYGVDLRNIFGLKCPKLPAATTIISAAAVATTAKRTVVPTPVQDIADALCICDHGVMLLPTLAEEDDNTNNTCRNPKGKRKEQKMEQQKKRRKR